MIQATHWLFIIFITASNWHVQTKAISGYQAAFASTHSCSHRAQGLSCQGAGTGVWLPESAGVALYTAQELLVPLQSETQKSTLSQLKALELPVTFQSKTGIPQANLAHHTAILQLCPGLQFLDLENIQPRSSIALLFQSCDFTQFLFELSSF